MAVKAMHGSTNGTVYRTLGVYACSAKPSISKEVPGTWLDVWKITNPGGVRRMYSESAISGIELFGRTCGDYIIVIIS